MVGTVNTVNTGDNDLLMGFFYEKVPAFIGSLSDQLLFPARM